MTELKKIIITEDDLPEELDVYLDGEFYTYEKERTINQIIRYLRRKDDENKW